MCFILNFVMFASTIVMLGLMIWIQNTKCITNPYYKDQMVYQVRHEAYFKECRADCVVVHFPWKNIHQCLTMVPLNYMNNWQSCNNQTINKQFMYFLADLIPKYIDQYGIYTPLLPTQEDLFNQTIIPITSMNKFFANPIGIFFTNSMSLTHAQTISI